MTKIHAEANIAIRTVDPVELDAVSGGLVTMLYDITIGGLRYTGWMNDSNGSWIIDVNGPESGHGYVSKGGFNPN